MDADDGVLQGQADLKRVLTLQSRLAMPETNIDLFPDVGGGHFLAACPGHVAEWLALSSDPIQAGDAIVFGLGDVGMRSADLPALLNDRRQGPQPDADRVLATVQARMTGAPPAASAGLREAIDRHFSGADLPTIMSSLAAAGASRSTDEPG